MKEMFYYLDNYVRATCKQNNFKLLCEINIIDLILTYQNSVYKDIELVHIAVHEYLSTKEFVTVHG